MSTANSPLSKLIAESNKMARQLKSDCAALMKARGKGRDALSFGIVMDDKMLKIEIPWAAFDASTVAELAALILKQMQQPPQH